MFLSKVVGGSIAWQFGKKTPSLLDARTRPQASYEFSSSIIGRKLSRPPGKVVRQPRVTSRLVGNHSWVEEFPGAITVCDSKGVILEMNAKAAANFKQEGGKKLIGKNLFDCHPEHALTKLRKLLRRRRANVYTVEKRGKRELIYQAPWFRSRKYRGFVELSLELPAHVPHFNRDLQNAR